MNGEVWEEAVAAWLQEFRSAALKVHFRFPEDPHLPVPEVQIIPP